MAHSVTRLPIKFEESKAATQTLRDAIRHCASHLHRSEVALGQGTQEIHDEAVSLVLWALHLPPDTLEPYLDSSLSHSEKEVIYEALRRRCQKREPLAYLTGEAWLAGLRFRADPRALIPRSPIAQVLAEGLQGLWRAPQAPATILDMCTGSASLAITAAHCFPEAAVTAVDLSADALALAQENVRDHHLEDRVKLIHGDSLGAITGQMFELVICNPPYVNTQSMGQLPAEFNQEPLLALDGGPSGMRFIDPFIKQLGPHIHPNGALLLELGHEADAFEALFAQHFEFAYVPVPAGDRLLVWIEAPQLHGYSQAA